MLKKKSVLFIFLCCVVLLVLCSCLKKSIVPSLDTDGVTQDIESDVETQEMFTDRDTEALELPLDKDTEDEVSFTPGNTEAEESVYIPKDTRPTAPVTTYIPTQTEQNTMDTTESAEDIGTEDNMSEGVIVADAPADFYTDPDRYESYLNNDSEYARDVMVTPTRELKDFKFFTFDLTKYMTDNVCEVTEVLYTKDALSAQRPFVARIWIPEFISSYAISYLDTDGNTRVLMFVESGLDGSVHLAPIE